MSQHNNNGQNQRQLFTRFWQSAFRFWRGRHGWIAWSLTVGLVALVLLQLFVQYRLNLWNREFFDALERRDRMALWQAAALFLPLAGASVLLAAVSVWGRMTAQRKWRESLTKYMIEYWLADGNYRKIDYAVSGQQNPEYRIAEDARIATDSPVDLATALLASFLTAAVFFEVLWTIGGALTVNVAGAVVTIPGYLVIGVIVYSVSFTTAMVVVGRRLTDVIQDKNQAEAALRGAANALRETNRGHTEAGEEARERHELWRAFQDMLERWRDLCWELVRMTFVSQSNVLAAPVVAWLLCAPKYISGAMTLGELTQAAAAFVTVQGAFNWLVDNFQRIADWRSAALRVATLLVALDEACLLERPAERPDSGATKIAS
jgi:putative ATP-binding cassette transporter